MVKVRLRPLFPPKINLWLQFDGVSGGVPETVWAQWKEKSACLKWQSNCLVPPQGKY